MRAIARLFKIAQVIGTHRLDQLFDAQNLPLVIKILFRLNPYSWSKAPESSLETRIRLALEELGPVFVKFGQALSTRRDLCYGLEQRLSQRLRLCRFHVQLHHQRPGLIRIPNPNPAF